MVLVISLMESHRNVSGTFSANIKIAEGYSNGSLREIKLPYSYFWPKPFAQKNKQDILPVWPGRLRLVRFQLLQNDKVTPVKGIQFGVVFPPHARERYIHSFCLPCSDFGTNAFADNFVRFVSQDILEFFL